MPVTIPFEVYEEFERGLGKEGARKVVKALESVISDATEYKWKSTKDEILDAMRKEFVTRELFEERMNNLRVELEGRMEKNRVELEGRIEKNRVELEGRMEKNRVELEGRMERLNTKLNFIIILMIIALTLMNPVAAEIIKNFLKL